MKFILVLIVGLAAGYSLGYKDGKAGKPTPVERIVNSVGKSKAAVGNDIDAQMQKVESTKPPEPKPEPKK
jgi:hypothetical protein